jgi:hypothetical protein
MLPHTLYALMMQSFFALQLRKPGKSKGVSPSKQKKVGAAEAAKTLAAPQANDDDLFDGNFSSMESALFGGDALAEGEASNVTDEVSDDALPEASVVEVRLHHQHICHCCLAPLQLLCWFFLDLSAFSVLSGHPWPAGAASYRSACSS